MEQPPIERTPREPKGERITADEQLERWVAGEPVHRRFDCSIVDRDRNVVGTRDMDECTPDFACCQPELLAAVEVRQAFAAASERDRYKFLGTFLGAALELSAKKRAERGEEAPRVHIAGKELES